MIIPAWSITKASSQHSSESPLHRFDGYEIVFLSIAANRSVAQHETARYAVSLSGGLGSAIAGERAVRRYGRDQVCFWFADVLKEDEDLYRFLHDLMKRWGGRLYWFSSGVRPERVWEKHGIIPNNWMCPCSYELKVKYFREFILAMPALPHVLIGYKADEGHRQARTCVSYAKAIPDSIVEYPIVWEPVEHRDLRLVCQEELGIVPPRVYALGFDYDNCLAGETRFLTFDGTKALKEMVGQKPLVMTTYGQWKSASIQSFGTQQLWEVKIKRHRYEKNIYATVHHRWFAYEGTQSNNQVELFTAQLTSGTHLVSVYGRSLKHEQPSHFGIAHGIVFGDGTRFSGRAAPASVVLCGEKDAELLKYFPLSPRKKVDGVGIRVNDLPRFFKDYPSLNESRPYLYGWLSGYFAADGHMSKRGFATISSASLENLEFVRTVCSILGIGTTHIYSTIRTGLGKEPTDLYTVGLKLQTLKENFFLLSEHRRHAQEIAHKASITPDTWIVVSVQPTDRVEEVFCAVVPDTHCFVLEENILTGNCGTDCCRSGIGGRVLEAIYFPDRYQQSMEWEEMMRAKGGALAGKAFCARVVNGKKVPLTLREILHTYVPPARAYLQAHPQQWVSEKTLLREIKRWQREIARSAQTSSAFQQERGEESV